MLFRCRFLSSSAGSSGSSGASASPPGATSTVDQDEVKKFGRLSQKWWDRSGEFAALHTLNEIRIPLIHDAMNQMNAPASPLPLKGMNLLDVGCGGGLLSEVSMAWFLQSSI